MAIKICHIITRLDLGGSAENTLLTAIGLRRKGYDVSVVCGRSDNPPSANEERAKQLGIPIIRIQSMGREISPATDFRSLVALTAHLLKNRCDILHTHTSKAGILGRIAGLLAGVKTIVHTPHGHIFYGYFSRQLTKIFVVLEWITTLWTDALITLTNKEKQDYLRKKIGSPAKIVPVLSGIDLDPFFSIKSNPENIRQSFGLTCSDFVAGTVARLVPVKNHDYIISAAALLKERCPSLKFVFVGDGELRAALESRTRELGIADRFVFAGWRNDIPECLSVFDVFVMCSRNEGMGRAFVEAQASGVPVIGSRVGGVEEVLSEGKTGFLVDPEKPGELASILHRLYGDRGLLGRMADACRRFVRPAFSSDVMVRKIEELYGELLARGKPPIRQKISL